jgi:hypothetical protein
VELGTAAEAGFAVPGRALRRALPGLRDPSDTWGVRAVRIALIVFLLAGYLVAVVPARLCHLDIGGFRRSLWVGIGSRRRWLLAVRVGYLAFGWPSLGVALAWRTSTTRAALVEVRSQMKMHGGHHVESPSGSVS